jgi:hypothetical protein
LVNKGDKKIFNGEKKKIYLSKGKEKTKDVKRKSKIQL